MLLNKDQEMQYRAMCNQQIIEGLIRKSNGQLSMDIAKSVADSVVSDLDFDNEIMMHFSIETIVNDLYEGLMVMS